MSYTEKIFEMVVAMAGDMGEIKAGMEEMKQDIAELKKKKPWYSTVDWSKVGKGAAYFLLSALIASGGVAGLDKWLGIFK
jgi:hypothetical protein